MAEKDCINPDVVTSLADRFALDVAVIASPDAASSARAFTAELGGRGIAAATSVDALDLLGNAALLGKAALFVGMDSGPAHLAVAQGVPAIVLTPNPVGSSPTHTGAPERFRPWTDAARLLLLRPGTHAPPCTDGCDSDGPHCLLGLGTGQVREAVLGFAGRMLARRPGLQGFQR